LREYFSGQPTVFDLPLDPVGTPFQREVWAALGRIGWGETRTYGQIAADLGRPGASRAVGMANNRNPIAIVIPCHRVIGANGSLTGYAGGLHVKSRLLSLESPNADAIPAIGSTERTATSHSRGRVTALPAAV
jgi:methylated-DNA-[protein]-cysteine S-methyltransferase